MIREPFEMPAEADLAARFLAVEALFPARVAELLGVIDPLIAEADASGERVLHWRLLLLKGNGLLYLGRVDETVALLDRHEPEIRAGGQPRAIAGMLNLRAVIADRRSGYDDAIHYLQEALEHARGLGEPIVLATITTNMGLDFAYLGEYGSALALLEEALEMLRQAGEPPNIIPTLINLGMTCDRAGQTDLAIRHFEEALAKSRAVEDPRRSCMALVNLAAIHAKNGDHKASAAMAQEAFELSACCGDPLVRAHALGAAVPAAIGLGDLDAARAALTDALEIYEQSNLNGGIVLCALGLAELPTTPPEEALTLGLRALEIAQAANLHADEVRAHLLLAQQAKADGDWQTAFTETEAARGLERQLYDEETQRRTQAVRVRREIEDLNRELARERHERGEISRLLAAVSEQRAIAEEASRQKSALLGIAAHDLRNGLSGIIGCLELVSDFVESEGPMEEIREMVDLARQAADDVFATLLRLIDHSAIERGQVSSHPEEFCLQTNLTKVVAGWSRELAAKEQEVIVTGLDDGIRILADPDRWGQVFSNLLSNAVKYSPIGVAIDLVVRTLPERWIRIEFCDRGPGISEQDQSRMFRPFQTLSARPTGGELATGLGLHIVKGLVDNEGGRIGYQGREGGGSVFWVELRAIG